MWQNHHLVTITVVTGSVKNHCTGWKYWKNARQESEYLHIFKAAPVKALQITQRKMITFQEEQNLT